jgi:CRP/FNR family transcriptional regulator, anaerobic regulatory protein
MEKIYDFIQNFMPFSVEEFQTMKRYFKQVKLKKGDFLAKEGEICRFLAFIEKGMLRNYYLIDGKEITRYVSLENSFSTAFGSFTKKEPSQEYVQAIESCQLYVLSYENLHKLYEVFPKMNALFRVVVENEYYGMEKRVFEMIALTAEQRYEIMLKERPDLIHRVAQQYLASMLGISPETLSRIRKKITPSNS